MNYWQRVMALMLVFFCGPAQSGIIDFRFSTGDGLATFSETVDGATVIFSNPANDGVPTFFRNDGDGVFLGTDGGGTSWDIVFDTDVRLLSFTVDLNNNPANAIFNITGPGVNISGESPDIGLNVFASAPEFLAGETYTFAKATPSSQPGSFPFEIWTTELIPAAIPLPSAASLFGVAGLLLLRLRRRCSQASLAPACPLG